MPKKIFIEQEMMPTPGLTVAFDNNLGKIISVSGGRVLVDFNNPLAGKDIEYEFTIKRMVNDLKEKAEALQHFLFGQAFPFEIDENKKTIVFQDLKLASILQVFNQKFKDTLGYGVEILEKKNCATAFKILPQELELYRKLAVALPRKCPNCRFYERIKSRGEIKLYDRRCECAGKNSSNGVYKNTREHHHGDSACESRFMTAYPENDQRIIYCTKCYEKEIL